jgi:glycerate 2-kinase
MRRRVILFIESVPIHMSHPLTLQALDIWCAGVDAVRPERLLRNVLHRAGDSLVVCDQEFRLADIDRIAVVGAGKAGAGMAEAVEGILGDDLVDQKVTGWINVPADCVRPLRRIHLHAARPAGVNEPTAEGVHGSEQILQIVSQLGPLDLCLVLLSGGGSALLPAPVPEISLADKQAVTRFLMHAGATIHELNTVRKKLSRIKGGGLALASRAAATMALVISDVVGDPLDIIASGPTVPDPATAADALAVLKKFGATPPEVPQTVFDFLNRESAPATAEGRAASNHIIGNNESALTAAAAKAREFGYTVHSLGSNNQGEANAVGRELAELCVSIRDRGAPVSPPVCILSGGEPVVHVVKTDRPRKGGRNQQLVLAAVERLWTDGMDRIAILSGGTDGEDGPTDAAGAVADADLLARAKSQERLPADDLAINNAYHFFEEAGGLIKTGPTNTNVMDLRVAIVARS